MTLKIGFRVDGASISGRRKYDLLSCCDIIFGGPTRGASGGTTDDPNGTSQWTPNGTHMSQVSRLRSQVSGLTSQVSGIRYRASAIR